jgi:hypothetical protein
MTDATFDPPARVVAPRLQPALRRATAAVGAIVFASLLAVGLGSSAAADDAPVLNPPPTAQDWAALAKLPDWSGVWFPESWQVTTARHPPSWTPAVAKDVAALQALDKAGHPKGLFVDCLPEGMPSFMIMTLASTEFLYTPGRVTILNEFDGNRQRRIYTDGRGHPDDPDLTFDGHSIGHWEGDTLVVDTVAVLPQTYLPISQSVGIPNDGDMHIVERFHLVAPDHLVDDMVIDAPHVLAAPWKVTRNFTRTRERRFDIVEASCRQGDFTDGKDEQGHAAFLPIKHTENGAPLPPPLTKVK